MLKKKYISDIYLLFAVLFGLKSILYGAGSLISVIVSYTFVAFTLVFAVASLSTNIPKLLKIYLCLIITLFFYGIVLLINGDTIVIQSTGATTGGFQYLYPIIMSNLPIFSSYYLSKKQMVSETHLRYWFYIFLVMSILVFYNYQQNKIASVTGNSFSDDVVNNQAYLFAGIIPMLCLFDKQRIIQYMGIGICFFFLIIGMKRGAILTGTIEIVILLYYTLQSSSNRRKILIIIFILFLFLGACFFLRDMFLTNDFFSARYYSTIEGDSSNRDVISSRMVDFIINGMNLPQFLFGCGAQSTVKMFVDYAHNDWLELMINQGLLGVSFYLFYFIYFIKTIRRTNKGQNKIALILVFTALIIPTFFSMSYSSISFPLAFYYGYNVAKLNH